jgi:hypothetical protein
MDKVISTFELRIALGQEWPADERERIANLVVDAILDMAETEELGAQVEIAFLDNEGERTHIVASDFNTEEAAEAKIEEWAAAAEKRRRR